MRLFSSSASLTFFSPCSASSAYSYSFVIVSAQVCVFFGLRLCQGRNLLPRFEAVCCITTVNNHRIARLAPPRMSKSFQVEIFEEVSDLVTSALDGHNVTILAYGQTGSGKTHTLLGSRDGPARGLIPRTVEHVLLQARVDGAHLACGFLLETPKAAR